MKKPSMSVLTASMCVVLSVSAFAIPVFANADLKSVIGKVMEKETPKEYMNDFIAQEADESERAIFLTEEQIQPSKISAEKVFRETLGINMPDDLAFEYSAERNPGEEDVSIRLDWKGKTKEMVWRGDGTRVEEPVTLFTAYFQIENFPKGQPMLMNLYAYDGFDDTMLATFKKQGLEALEKELNMTVPEDEYTFSATLSSYVGAESEFNSKGTTLNLSWHNQKHSGEQEISEGYSVGFSDVDLSQNTGRVVILDKYVDDFNNPQNGMQIRFPTFNFTESQQNEMLEAARNFLVEKGAAVGSLRTSQPSNLGTAIWFRFDVEDGSMMNTVSVTVTPELDIMGYSIRVR